MDRIAGSHDRVIDRIKFPSEREIEGLFREHLAAQPEFINLLDLSSHEGHYGVALETLSDARARQLVAAIR